jgi:hypothetical protein
MSYTNDHNSEDRKSAERGASGEPASHPGAQSLQDKAAINAGYSGDKIAGLDLGASPLGTDDEASGLSPTVEPTAAHAPMNKPHGAVARDPNRANAVPPKAPWLWIVLAVVAALVLGFVLLSALV